jgi:hypothetical protein
MISGGHKLFNKKRHRILAEELNGLGIHAVGFNQCGCRVQAGLRAFEGESEVCRRDWDRSIPRDFI